MHPAGAHAVSITSGGRFVACAVALIYIANWSARFFGPLATQKRTTGLKGVLPHMRASGEQLLPAHTRVGILVAVFVSLTAWGALPGMPCFVGTFQ